LLDKKDVASANIKLSSLIADHYNETEPHYKKENIFLTSVKIESLQRRTKGTDLLDMGCGTGFMIDIAKHYFLNVYGVDISREMLDKVNREKDSGYIRLINCFIDDIDLESESIDVCTAYATLHHLHDISSVVKEAYRVLKKGGIFYSSLDPNFYFFSNVKQIDTMAIMGDALKREMSKLEEETNNHLYQIAEPIKHLKNGFKEEDLLSVFTRVGYSDIKIGYYWFLGESKLIHSDESKAEEIRYYLQKSLPLSRNMFKYLEIEAIK